MRSRVSGTSSVEKRGQAVLFASSQETKRTVKFKVPEIRSYFNSNLGGLFAGYELQDIFNPYSEDALEAYLPWEHLEEGFNKFAPNIKLQEQEIVDYRTGKNVVSLITNVELDFLEKIEAYNKQTVIEDLRRSNNPLASNIARTIQNIAQRNPEEILETGDTNEACKITRYWQNRIIGSRFALQELKKSANHFQLPQNFQALLIETRKLILSGLDGENHFFYQDLKYGTEKKEKYSKTVTKAGKTLKGYKSPDKLHTFNGLSHLSLEDRQAHLNSLQRLFLDVLNKIEPKASPVGSIQMEELFDLYNEEEPLKLTKEQVDGALKSLAKFYVEAKATPIFKEMSRPVISSLVNAVLERIHTLMPRKNGEKPSYKPPSLGKVSEDLSIPKKVVTISEKVKAEEYKQYLAAFSLVLTTL